MTVLEKRGNHGSGDMFPIGMRVLAVDDNPTCLKILEYLLLKCQYHVTTTNQARKALKMLRENKDQFDLIISDVHMPDMDGFKLLELVGLEMELPVIMLSANGETQAVMKGITHGACDYLIKPVRIEELKNIWQHVIRKKKYESRDDNSVDNTEECNNNQIANSVIKDGPSDQSLKLNKKRKDQDEEDDDENEDPSAPKKQRVVWSVELHRKFVAAVNHLGLEKAVPKRILDLMNVEGLTRENVASHLQKYRLYLKRLSAVANQQANMAAALRGRDSSYLLMNSLDGYPNFNSLNGFNSRPIQTTTCLPQMNSFTGFGHHGFQRSTNQAIPSPLEASNRLLSGFSNSEISNNHPSSSRIQSLTTDPFEISYLGGNTSNVAWKFANNHTSSINIVDNVSPMVSQLAQSDHVIGSGNGKCSLLDFRRMENFELKFEERIQNSNTTYMNSSLASAPNFMNNNQSIATPLLAHNLTSVTDVDLLFDDTKLPNGFDVTGYGIDDLEANVMIKPEIEDFTLLDGDVGGSDLFSLGVL